MTVIGIDPSINSTGICVLKDNEEPIYYIIASSDKYKSKKSQEFIEDFNHPRIKIFLYKKEKHVDNTDKYANYAQKEWTKSYNMFCIENILKSIISKHCPDKALMEGISYGSVGSQALADLAGLNYILRKSLFDCKVPVTIIAPTEVKKAAIGNGGATKEAMVHAWKKCDPSIYKDISDTPIVVDDIADAYFIAKMNTTQS